MSDEKKEIQAGDQAWKEATLGPVLEKRPERKKSFEASSGFEVERLYSPVDQAGQPYMRKIGFPGEYRFTRGV